MNTLMGPPGMSEPDMRLAGLKAHQAALAAQPKPEGKPSIQDLLMPLIIAQGLDMLSTEKPIGFNKRDDIHEVNNKFPGARAKGFGGTVGRLGSGLSELALAALLAKKSPRLAKLYIAPATGVHMDFADKNWKIMREAELADRMKGKR
jgi:hypothetical protein